MNYAALICARGGTKGLPGKNIAELGGKPLVGWAADIACRVSRLSRIIISTDSLPIADTAQRYGAEAPFIRPAHLAEDSSPEWLVWQHALHFLTQQGEKVDALVIIPPTAPLREVIDIDNCLDLYERGEADVVITVTDAHRNPYFNMVKMDAQGNSSLVIEPDQMVSQRQNAPKVYDMTTVAYVISSGFLLQASNIFEGRVQSVQVPAERAVDIDTPLDLELARFMLQNREEQVL